MRMPENGALDSGCHSILLLKNEFVFKWNMRITIGDIDHGELIGLETGFVFKWNMRVE